MSQQLFGDISVLIIRSATLFYFHKLGETVAGSLLRNPKDKLPEVQTPGVYEITCSCGKSYIGQTGRAIATRIKEHEKDVDYQRTEKSAVAEHAKNKGHDIQFDKVKILNKETHFGKRIYKVAIEIEKCPENFNRYDGWKISKTWLPIIHQTKIKSTNNTENSSIQEKVTINVMENCSTVNLFPNSNQIILKLSKEIEELDYLNSKSDIELKLKSNEIVKLNEEVENLKNYLSIEKNLSSNLEKEKVELKLRVITYVKCNEELRERIREVEIEKEEKQKIIDCNQRKLDNLKNLNDQIIIENKKIKEVNSKLENNYKLQKTEDNLIVLKLSKKIQELKYLNSKINIELKMKSNEIIKLIEKKQGLDDFKKNKELSINNDVVNIQDLHEKINTQIKIISDLENKYERYKMYVNCILKM
ncbi:uncharacterized protein MAL8P1.12-like [Daktulosphaira vitifoliae]|uniref:uncharacterized protein MAL8P1.12-like n=1 Tax=Daktulosphaira vitifoliae TaxID=58002 RepID=UPI0021A9F9BB|nr:uncharacterized protein MAL8P1.12-like [Daktulosphaira vitifoliae]